MGTQHRKIVAVAAEHSGFVFNPGCYIPLIKQATASHNSIGQLDGCLIQQNHINAVGANSAGQFVGQPGLQRPPIRIAANQQTQVIIAQRAWLTLHLRAKEVDKLHGRQAGHYRRYIISQGLYIHPAQCNISRGKEQLWYAREGTSVGSVWPSGRERGHHRRVPA